MLISFNTLHIQRYSCLDLIYCRLEGG